MKRRLTVSRVALAAECTYWLTPGVEWSDVRHVVQTDGTAMHESAAEHVDGVIGSGDKSERAGALMGHLRPILDALLGGDGKLYSEVAFAWDPATDTAQVLNLSSGRNYSAARPGELCGTADLVIVHPGRVDVYDYKSSVPGHTPADASLQLRTLSLMAARAFDREIAHYAPIEVHDRGAQVGDVEAMGFFDLEAMASELAELLAAPSTAPQPGPHCRERYCGARGACPATQQAMSQATPQPSLYRFGAPVETQEQAAWLLTSLDLIEEGIKAEREKLRAFADATGGVTLANGAVWSAKSKTVEKPDLTVPGAADELRAMGAANAIALSTTWADVERAIGPADAEFVRDRLRTIGAVKSSTYDEYRARKPKNAPKRRTLKAQRVSQ